VLFSGEPSLRDCSRRGGSLLSFHLAAYIIIDIRKLGLPHPRAAHPSATPFPLHEGLMPRGPALVHKILWSSEQASAAFLGLRRDGFRRLDPLMK
jgi:hypothetical protein